MQVMTKQQKHRESGDLQHVLTSGERGIFAADMLTERPSHKLKLKASAAAQHTAGPSTTTNKDTQAKPVQVFKKVSTKN